MRFGTFSVASEYAIVTGQELGLNSMLEHRYDRWMGSF